MPLKKTVVLTKRISGKSNRKSALDRAIHRSITVGTMAVDPIRATAVVRLIAYGVVLNTELLSTGMYSIIMVTAVHNRRFAACHPPGVTVIARTMNG